MKKKIGLLVLFGCLGLTILYRQEIVRYLMVHFIYHDSEVVANHYYQAYQFEYVQLTEEEPKNKQDLLNVIYTNLNKGMDQFAFYCPKSYKNCIKEMEELIENNVEIGNINNLVHPFNSFSRLQFQTDQYGRVEVKVNHLYSEEEIALVSRKVDQLYAELVDSKNSTEENIRAIHDYLINHTTYDEEAETWDYSGKQVYPQKSNTAYGLLFNHVSICGGYTDTMALFLSKMGLKNYRIASDTHIWNLVELNGTWKHLDLTWDDPVTSNHENLLLHTYFLIDTKELNRLGDQNHNYNNQIYLEANKNA